MDTRNTLKLRVFESGLSNEEIGELITMIESASTIEDIDHFNEVFNEKVKEIPYIQAKIIANNKNAIKTLKESEYADEFSDVIASMEKYNSALIDLWKKGVEPNDPKYDDIFMEYMDEFNEKMSKKTMALKLKYAEISAKGSSSTAEEVKAIKEKIDASLDFKKKVKEVAKDMKNNVVDAAKKAAEETKDKVDELREKIADVKKSKNKDE